MSNRQLVKSRRTVVYLSHSLVLQHLLDVRLVGQMIIFSITFHVSFPGIILVSVLAAAAVAVWIQVPKLCGLYFLY
jgi:hypothetical protein